MAKTAKYWIYHIPGVKIGVSNNPDVRTKIQGFTEYEILEEHTNAKVVSKREQELQAQYGYPVDKIEYWKTLNWQKKGQTKEARKKAANSLDYKARVIDWAKKVANTDWEARSKNTDWEARTAKIDYKKISEALSRKVNQYDLNNNLLHQFNSITEAGLSLNKPYRCNPAIIRCLNGKQKHAFKFIWKYA